MFKKDWGEFSGFYGSLRDAIEKGRKKGVVKRTRKRETVNDPKM
jgi:hypothetical protein